MSRSNGNNGHSGPPPQQPHPGYAQGAPAHHPYPQTQPPEGARAAQQTAQWSPYQPPAPPDLSGYGQSAQPQRPHHQADQHPPQYHFPPSEPHAQPAHQGYGEPQLRTGQPQHAAPSQQAPGSGLASYTPRGERQPAPAEARRYDLANFGPPAARQAPQQPTWEEPRHGEIDPYAGQQAAYQHGYVPPQEQPQWSPPAETFAHARHAPHQGGHEGGYAPAVDAHGYPLHQGHDPSMQGYADPNAHYQSHGDPGQYGHVGQDGQPHQQQQYEGEYDDGTSYEEEPKKRGRGLLVVAALVSAIVAGGGMAYLYKTFAGGGVGGKAPVLKAEQTPPKSRPTNPGGKEFPHAERKITERLGDGQPATETAAAASSEPVESGGPRRVQIIPIAPGGGQPVAGAPPPETPARATISVPGMVVDTSQLGGGPRPIPQQDSATGRQPQGQQQAARPQVQQQQPPAKAPVQPKAAEQPPADAAAAPVKRAAVSVPRPPKANDALTSQGAPTAAAPAASGSNGFVAVLSSQKSRMDALKVFADLQQRYGDVLSNKPADVQEANLGERGVFYRAVVGPPGSRESAAQLCTQLKAAGFNGCWVTAY